MKQPSPALPPALFAALITAAPLVTALAAPAAHARPLDVVFVLDTTGSMSAEITEAKDRVQQIAKALQAQRHGDVVRIGVVAYRDRSDDYRTLPSPLSPDVSKAFHFLTELSAGGGGDEPEDVLAGLETALTKSGFDDRETVDRAIFLIGDAPAHTDYADDPSLEAVIDRAREKQVVIHAVGCRSLPPEGVEQFRKLAYGTEGTYQHIGRVDVGSRDLSQAVLEALDHKQGAARRPVDVKLEHKDAAIDNHQGIEVTRSAARDDGSCSVEVSVPDGIALANRPRAAIDGASLVVTLALTAGGGSSSTYTVSSCGAAPVAVEIDGGAL